MGAIASFTLKIGKLIGFFSILVLFFVTVASVLTRTADLPIQQFLNLFGEYLIVAKHNLNYILGPTTTNILMYIVFLLPIAKIGYTTQLFVLKHY